MDILWTRQHLNQYRDLNENLHQLLLLGDELLVFSRSLMGQRSRSCAFKNLLTHSRSLYKCECYNGGGIHFDIVALRLTYWSMPFVQCCPRTRAVSCCCCCCGCVHNTCILQNMLVSHTVYVTMYQTWTDKWNDAVFLPWAKTASFN